MESVLAIFRAHDSIFGGHITRNELLELLQQLKEGAWSKEAVDSLLLYAGFPVADMVPYESFLSWVFGGVDADLSSAAVVPIHSDKEGDWLRLGGAELEEALAKGWVKLVRADWLVWLAGSGGILPRCQDLPPEARVGLDELKQAGRGVLTLPSGTVEMVRVIVLSYPWLQPGHPDPHGENLRLIAKVLKLFVHDSAFYCNGGKPWGVLIDFTGIPQVPRTDEENKVFTLALSALNIFYSHPHTVVLKVTKFPEGYPGNSEHHYDLPEGANTVAYANRGWCFAESAMSGLVKSSSNVLDLGRDIHYRTLWELIFDCKVGRSPPLHPGDFKEQLSKKAFTCKAADFGKVAQLYSNAFERRLGSATELDYHGLGWDGDAMRKLVRALRHTTSLESLDLSENHIGSDGATVLGEALQSNTTLQSLNLSDNNIDCHGAAALGKALQGNCALQSLNLFENEIGPVGAAALGEALQSNHSLQSLNLWENNIGPFGAAALGEALQANCSLQSLNLRDNEIGPQGAVALGKALRCNKSLQTLDLSGNDVGIDDARGAVALGEALQGNCSLQSLNLEWNGIGTQGAVALGQALQKNTSLQVLDLGYNDIGLWGMVALGRGVQTWPTLMVKRERRHSI